MAQQLLVALYARVSTNDQHTANQLLELREFCARRGWTVAREFVDTGVSGAKTTRPALDELMAAARRRRIDMILVSRLDRLGRSLRHLILTLDELTALGVGFASLNEGIDTSTPAGKLQLHILGAIAEFERGRIAERIHLGIARARAQGKRLGRRRKTPLSPAVPKEMTVRRAAALWGCSKSEAARRLSTGLCPPQAERQRGVIMVDGRA